MVCSIISLSIRVTDQKINFRLVIVETGTRRCSKATISSAETMLLRMLRQSIVDSLKALASISMSSIMMRLLLMSKSFSELLRCLITSHSLAADFPEILVSDKWQTRMLYDASKPMPIWRPASSPIYVLSFRRISLRLPL